MLDCAGLPSLEHLRLSAFVSGANGDEHLQLTLLCIFRPRRISQVLFDRRLSGQLLRVLGLKLDTRTDHGVSQDFQYLTLGAKPSHELRLLSKTGHSFNQ